MDRSASIVASMLWRRLDLPGHDACSLERSKQGWTLHGAAVFAHTDGPARIAYTVRCDTQWRTRSGRVRGAIGTRPLDFAIERRRGRWTLNGVMIPDLGHLVDLDLSFTPATNLQQLRRVKLALNETVSLPVAWLDVDTWTITELPQIYERRSEYVVAYKAPSVGYEGLLELASNGFIRRYPDLWAAEE